VSVSHALGLISPSTRDAVNQAREYRNLIHPGRAQRLSMKCKRATALFSVGAIEAIVVDPGVSVQLPMLAHESFGGHKPASVSG